MARLNIKGQSLIELIVAIAIGMILMGTATAAVVLILRVNSDTRSTQTAVSLAQEYLDSILTISKSNWNNIYGLNKGTNYLYSIKNLYLSQISGGAWHTCGVKADKTAYCWGGNGFGQLGDNTQLNKSTPIQILGVGGSGNLTNVIQITSGGNHTCAIKTDGSAYCWGYNGNGQLGDNTTTQRLTPVQVLNLANVSQVTSRENHTCAIKTDGSAYCWGYNGNGQLGDNTTTQRLTPVQVKGVGASGYLTNVFQITAGVGHTCGVINDGLAYCWGFNGSGQLGDNSITDSWIPVRVWDLTSVSQIINIAGINHTCAIETNGLAYCWGSDGIGQLGDDIPLADKYRPTQVLNLINISQITAGGQHTCAIKTDGSAYCWGANNNGQLGDNTIIEKSTPVQVLGVGASGYLYLNPNAFIRKIMSGVENLFIDGQNFTRYFFIENVNRTSCGVGSITSASVQNCPINFPGGASDIYEDPSTQKITIKTEWRNQSIAKTQYLTRHRDLIYRQTDWSGGPGQIYFPTSTTGTQINNRFDVSANINYASSGLIKQSSMLTTGYATSSVFDFIEASTTINSIVWQGTPNGGSVSFQLASSNNRNGPWNFIGPDGSISSYYTAGSGIPIKVNLAYHNNQRYFRYRILVLGGSGPAVDDVIINWSP